MSRAFQYTWEPPPEELNTPHAYGIRATSEQECIEVYCFFDLGTNSIEQSRETIDLTTGGKKISKEQWNASERMYNLVYCRPSQHPTGLCQPSMLATDVHIGRSPPRDGL